MLSNRKIYLKCLDDLKYLKTFIDVQKKEDLFLKDYVGTRSDIYNLNVSRECLEKIKSNLNPLIDDYNFLISYMKEENLLNGDDAEKDVLEEYNSLYLRFCEIFDTVSNMSQELNKIKIRIKRRENRK